MKYIRYIIELALTEEQYEREDRYEDIKRTLEADMQDIQKHTGTPTRFIIQQQI